MNPVETATTTSTPHRLAIVVSHPIQYYAPWFRDLAERPELDVRVFYLWDFGVTDQRDERFGQSFKWDIDLLSGYAHEFVPNVSPSPGTETFSGLNNPTLVDRVENFAPRFVLLFGYRYRSHLAVIRAARKHNWHLLFRGDSHLMNHAPAGILKRVLLRWVYKKFDGFLYVGQANRDYLQHFGVPANRLFFAPHSVDQSRFAQPPPIEQIQTLRSKLGADVDTKIVLFSGKLHAEKAPLDLLNAFTATKSENTLLVIAGDGEQRTLLEKTVKDRALKRVRFLPFANQTEMPLRYAIADLFVLPSVGLYETWGLAVNEAMHCGVPCIVSDRVGCHPNLVLPNQTGWVFPAGNVEALTRCLDTAIATLRDVKSRDTLLTAVTKQVSEYTYDHTTAGLIAAIAAVPTTTR